MTNTKKLFSPPFFHFLLLRAYIVTLSVMARVAIMGNDGAFFFCTGEAFEITLQKKKKRYNENNK